jgi:hypothetical protein
MALQGDDKIVVAGRSVAGGGASADLTLLRYTQDGELDESFSEDGKVADDIGEKTVPRHFCSSATTS